MNNLIQQFEQKDITEINSYGLWNGKAGLAIVYCLLMRHTNSDVFTEKALTLLDDISDNILSVRNNSFAEGITGIAWAIQWLTENEFLDINTDQALEDIDDSLYNTIVYSPDTDLSLSYGTLGKAIYFTKRHQSVNEGTIRFKALCQHECLVLLTNDIRTKLAEEQRSLVNEADSYGNEAVNINMAHALLFLSSFSNLAINVLVAEEALYSAISYSERVLNQITGLSQEQKTTISVSTLDSLQYLAFSYYMAGKQIKHFVWQQQGKQFIQQLNTIINLVQPKTPDEIIRQWHINSLLHTCIPDYQPIPHNGQTAKVDLHALPFTLQNGSGMAVLSLLGMYNPGLIANWHELIM